MGALRSLAPVNVDRPVRDRLEQLAARYVLGDGAVAQLTQLLELVQASPISLTTVREPLRAADIHVADSLAGLGVEALNAAGSIADLGAGAGYPGLVLAIARPAARVTLVESVGRKGAFLEQAVAAIGLENVEVVSLRAEEWTAGLGTQQAVTARALAALPVLLEYAAPLLAVGGSLVAWKGRSAVTEERAAASAAEQLGMSIPVRLEVASNLIRGADSRNLYVSSKLRPTPVGYPRRPGMARKRPLGAST